MGQVPDFIAAYTELTAPCTESPVVYHDWAIITAIGAMLSRNVWLQFGAEQIYPNLYTILLGPAAGRKSSAINFARKFLEQANFKAFAKDKSSKEKFLSDLARGFGKKPVVSNTEVEAMLEADLDAVDLHCPASNVLISAGELLDFLGANDLPFITLLVNLWDNLPKYEQPKLTGNDVKVIKPTISLLGGATATTFQTIFPPEMIGGGMLSRTIVVKGDGRRQALTLPPPPDVELFGGLLELIVEIGKMRGPMTYTPEAFELIDEIYKAEHPLSKTRFETFVGRRHVQLHKLCLILTATNLSYEITADTVLYANTLLHDVELGMQTALGEFGLSEANSKANSILNLLRVSHCTVVDMWKALSSDFKNKNEFQEILVKLKSAGRIDTTKSGRFFVAEATSDIQLPHYYPELLNYRGNV